ncbi:transposase, partial [Caballeronia sordidicola]|uniref:transposase n=1 Tax=Caballeronia sordidicola TaxID=196367 RepID=UPI001C4F6244
MDANDLNHLTPEVQAYIRALEAQNRQLAERIEVLEELFRLAQLKRFAPSSEKLKDRVFDEAEQLALSEPDYDDVLTLPDTGLPQTPAPVGKKRGRRPLPAHLRR